jgi:Ni2+-binding GTPase involved in maturation of urease and hydrogenase
MFDLFPSREAGPFGRRLKRERGARIPVTVITGFLGAGKTTLIRHFLASPEGQGTAVIVNEFGAVGIDDALVRDAAEQTILLGNGCVCCITRTDLQLALRQLLIDRERGLVPNFARVIIETSGLADPAPILQTFSTDRALGGEFHIDVMLTVVDAVNGEATLKSTTEARKQVILAIASSFRKAISLRQPASTRLSSACRNSIRAPASMLRSAARSILRVSSRRRPRSVLALSPKPSTATVSPASCSSDDNRSNGPHSPAPWRR